MKDIKEVLGLPRISIQDGEEGAIIKSVIINCNNKSLEYLVVERRTDDHAVLEAIPYTAVVGVGYYAITVDSFASVVDFFTLKLEEKQFKKYDDMLYQRIVTQIGDFIGVVLGFSFNENTGKIESILYKDDASHNKKLQRENLLTIGYRLLIVSSVDDKIETEKVSAIENVSRYVMPSNQPKAIALEDVKQPMSAVDTFLLNSLNDAMGKVLLSDIYDYEGNILLHEGTKISTEPVEKVRMVDENLVYEILANI